MAKLNQIIAIEKGIKSKNTSLISEIYKTAQKMELFNGFSRTYKPLDDDGIMLPPESKRVQVNVGDILNQSALAWSELINITARKDWTNTEAKASVTINDITIIEESPVSFLLFLEKTLTDVRTFINTLPILDESESWIKDENTGVFKTEAALTQRTKKIIKSLVLIEPTQYQPGQAQAYNEDILEGTWTTIKESGAIPKTNRIALLKKVDILLIAIKQAREEANEAAEVETKDIAGNIFSYLLG